MIRKIYIHLFFILILQPLFGQNYSGFYIEPTVSKKLYFNSNISRTPMQFQTAYVTIKEMPYILQKGIDIGLNMGYCFKNQHKIQLGIAQDQSLQGYSYIGEQLYPDFQTYNFYSEAHYSNRGGVAGTNFSILYKHHILHFQSNTLNPGRHLRVHLNIGLTYFYKPNNGIENLTGTDISSFIAPDSSLVTISSTEYVYPVSAKNSFKLNCGIDFTFCKKNKEKFSLNVSLITNNPAYGAFFSGTIINVDIKNKAGVARYETFIEGKGNGIYFTLSKRIYPLEIYKARKVRKEKRKERFEEYKAKKIS